MKILLGKHAGYCFGVRRAIAIVEKTVKQSKPVFSLGPVIHNPQETERLRKLGLRVVRSPASLRCGTLIVRTHGLPKSVRDRARRKGIRMVDATCPFVNRVRETAERLFRDGYHVVVVGERRHPEVRYILEPIVSRATVCARAAGARVRARRVGVVVQTTQAPETYADVVRTLALRADEIRAYDTVCRATRERQEEARRMAGRVDAMLVLGGRNSANTRRLAAICSAEGVPTVLRERLGPADARRLRRKKRVGITAGASTPGWIINEALNMLRE